MFLNPRLACVPLLLCLSVLLGACDKSGKAGGASVPLSLSAASSSGARVPDAAAQALADAKLRSLPRFCAIRFSPESPAPEQPITATLVFQTDETTALQSVRAAIRNTAGEGVAFADNEAAPANAAGHWEFTRSFTLPAPGGYTYAASAKIYKKTNAQMIEEIRCEGKLLVNGPYCTITATPTKLKAGGSVNLVWDSHNAGSISIDHGIGAVEASGQKTLAVTDSGPFTMMVSNKLGKQICQTADLTVYQNAQCLLKADRRELPPGGQVRLTWESSDVSATHSINPGIGSVHPSGSVMTKLPLHPGAVPYTFSVTGGGDSGGHCQQSVNIAVRDDVLLCDLRANPENIPLGGSATLVWASARALRSEINWGIGNVVGNGILVVSPDSSRVYTLSIADDQGNSQLCQARLRVTKPDAPLTIGGNPGQQTD